MQDAYWIDPKGKIIDVPMLHIKAIHDNPSLFNLSIDKLKKVYIKHSEEFSPFTEGKSREEIMYDLIQKGFIRLRYMPRQDSWTVQLNNLNDTNKNYLKDWAEKENIKKFSDIHIISNNGRIKSSADELINSKGQFQNIKSDKDLNKEYLKIRHTLNPIVKKQLDKLMKHDTSNLLSKGFKLPKNMTMAQYNFITKNEHAHLCFKDFNNLVNECTSIMYNIFK